MRRDTDELGLQAVSVIVNLRGECEGEYEAGHDQRGCKMTVIMSARCVTWCAFADFHQHRFLIELEQAIDPGAQAVERRFEPAKIIRALVGRAIVLVTASPDGGDDCFLPAR